MDRVGKFLKKWAAVIGFAAGGLVLNFAESQSPYYEFILAIGLVAFIGNAFLLVQRLRSKYSS